jgi:hypothetical protein
VDDWHIKTLGQLADRCSSVLASKAPAQVDQRTLGAKERLHDPRGIVERKIRS